MTKLDDDLAEASEAYEKRTTGLQRRHILWAVIVAGFAYAIATAAWCRHG